MPLLVTVRMFPYSKVVDLSPLLCPDHEKRRLKIRSFIYELDKTTMHEIDTMSHIGSHVEAPSHFAPGWEDISSLDLVKFFGEGVCIDLKYKGPVEAISVGDLEGKVKEGDIVLLHATKYEDNRRPYVSEEAAKWLSVHAKMLGIDDTVSLESSFESMASHRILLGNRVPIAEGLVNLDLIAGERIFFVGLPLRIKGLDASPIRAIALLLS